MMMAGACESDLICSLALQKPGVWLGGYTYLGAVDQRSARHISLAIRLGDTPQWPMNHTPSTHCFVCSTLPCTESNYRVYTECKPLCRHVSALFVLTHTASQTLEGRLTLSHYIHSHIALLQASERGSPSPREHSPSVPGTSHPPHPALHTQDSALSALRRSNKNLFISIRGKWYMSRVSSSSPFQRDRIRGPQSCITMTMAKERVGIR
ncbi:hypothetical protein FA13DRAFT_1514138 [Coprinellus micaceus]|uniref:Uncharacterized protein n=1 Tax=Coprinellus micaceus TaxID=71717 RepID=A0A4Y7SKT5_COPMI|nr:hypothetical protein FA13DRAFT_1514138 [Coprinellus micaceus]